MRTMCNSAWIAVASTRSSRRSLLWSASGRPHRPLNHRRRPCNRSKSSPCLEWFRTPRSGQSLTFESTLLKGVRAGVFAITDASGRYALPGMFSDAIVVRATKAGYVAVTKMYETAYPGPQALSFTMDLVDASTSIGGEYVASFTADGACTELPDIARARTYRATITRASWSPSPNHYQAILSGATFYPSTSNDRFVIGVARTFARQKHDRRRRRTPWLNARACSAFFTRVRSRTD